MVPEGVNITELAAEMRADGIAGASLAEEPLIAEALSGHDSVGVAIVPVRAQMPADYRDVAQELADATGLDTVIVRGVGTTSVVSEDYSRAAIETAQAKVTATPDHAAAVTQLLASVGEIGVNWWALGGALLILIALCAVATIVTSSAQR